VVRDTMDLQLEGVEITIPALKKRVLTKPDGSFILTDLPKGKYEIRARKIGYGPQVREVKINNDSSSMKPFELVPIPRALPAVVTSSARLGLSGVVADTAFAGLPGA